MRATVMYGAGEVRVEDVPDARLIEPTDALVRVTRAAICGSDLWPYKSMPHDDTGRRMGHEFIGVVDTVGSDVATIKVGDLVLSPSSTYPTPSFGRESFAEPKPRSRPG
jgi:threonine dehydrogenase-like Zn-dependent dehydrogenase